MNIKTTFIIYFLLLTIAPIYATEFVVGNRKITFITDNLVRLEFALDQKFLNDSTLFAINRKDFNVDVNVEVDSTRYIFKTSVMTVEMTDDGYPFGVCNLIVKFMHSGKQKKWRLSSKQKKNLKGAIETLDLVDGYADRMEGLISRDGWYLINDSGKDIYKNGELKLRDKDHIQDFYLFVYGNDYKSAMKSLSVISGSVPMPRKYVHGSWYCRWWPYTADDYRQILTEYDEHDFPIDIIVFDMDWHHKNYSSGTGHANMKGWTGYTWNRKLIPEPEDLISEFKEQNIHVVLNEHPHDGLRPEDDSYKTFIEELGETYSVNGVSLFNAGDKKYMDAFMKYAHGESDSMGVAFWWLDWQQDYIYPIVRGTTTKHLPWLNEIYYNYSSRDNLRGANFSRWGGWGDHRNPIHFSGDAVGNWETLKFEIDLTVTSGNQGCFFWAHDIGGFYKGMDPELYTRWTQFGLLNSSLRIHSIVGKNNDRRPWLWGKENENAMKRIYHLRSQLMPYIYSSVRKCHTETVPLIKGLYFEEPDSEESYKHPDHFYFGDLILASPVYTPGTGTEKIVNKEIWFPENEKWYNIFTFKCYEGGKTVSVPTPLDESPVFVKGGWPLPMQPYNNRMASASLDKLIVRCYPGNVGDNNTFQLYEDDGMTKDYMKGIYSTTNLNYRKFHDKIIVKVESTRGEYNGQGKFRSYEIELPFVKEVSEIYVNGKKGKYIYDKNIHGIRVLIQDMSIRNDLEVIIME